MGNPYTGDDARVLSLAGFPHLCSFPVEGVRKALRLFKESSEKKSKAAASNSNCHSTTKLLMGFY